MLKDNEQWPFCLRETVISILVCPTASLDTTENRWLLFGQGCWCDWVLVVSLKCKCPSLQPWRSQWHIDFQNNKYDKLSCNRVLISHRPDQSLEITMINTLSHSLYCVCTWRNVAEQQAGRLPDINAQTLTLLQHQYHGTSKKVGKLLFFSWGQVNMVMGERGQRGSDKCHEWGCCCTNTGSETPEGGMELAEICWRGCRSFPKGRGNLMGILRRPQRICCSLGCW